MSADRYVAPLPQTFLWYLKRICTVIICHPAVKKKQQLLRLRITLHFKFITNAGLSRGQPLEWKAEVWRTTPTRLGVGVWVSEQYRAKVPQPEAPFLKPELFDKLIPLVRQTWYIFCITDAFKGQLCFLCQKYLSKKMIENVRMTSCKSDSSCGGFTLHWWNKAQGLSLCVFLSGGGFVMCSCLVHLSRRHAFPCVCSAGISAGGSI